jgi:hypothetical protein
MEVPTMKLKWAVLSMLVLSLAVIPPKKANASGVAEGAAAAAAVAAQDHGQWDTPPQEFREIQRQGFHDGVEGARKDFDNHRRPDVDNRDEYRHPHVPESERSDYREGFRRGYEQAVQHLYGHRY